MFDSQISVQAWKEAARIWCLQQRARTEPDPTEAQKLLGQVFKAYLIFMKDAQPSKGGQVMHYDVSSFICLLYECKTY